MDLFLDQSILWPIIVCFTENVVMWILFTWSDELMKLKLWSFFKMYLKCYHRLISNASLKNDFRAVYLWSTGTAIVTESKAALWTDGRYYLQAEAQLDANWTLMKDGASILHPLSFSLHSTPTFAVSQTDIFSVTIQIKLQEIHLRAHLHLTIATLLQWRCDIVPKSNVCVRSCTVTYSVCDCDIAGGSLCGQFKSNVAAILESQ